MPDPITPTLAVEGPTGPIQAINANESKPSAIAAPESTRPEPRVLGPKKLADRSRVSVAEKLLGRTSKDEPPRTPDGKFAAPEGKKVAPKAKVETPAPNPASEPVAPVEPAPVVTKIKIGEQEMTPEEVTAHVAKLEAAANAQKPALIAPEPPKAPEPAAVVQSAQELEAEEKAREDAFLADFSERVGVKQEDFDKILANGDAVAFNQALARVAMDLRRFATNQINPAIDELRNGMKPIMARESELSEFQKEHNFLAANKDLAGEEGKKAYREGKRFVDGYHDQLKRLVKSGVATADEIENAKTLDDPERFANYVGEHARYIFKASQPAPVAVAPVVVPPKPRPQPPGGQPVGAGGGAPVSQAKAMQARMAHTRGG